MARYFAIFTFLIMIYLPCFTLAHSEVTPFFEENFYSSSVYVPGNCATNVWRFLNSLFENGVEIDESFKVIYVFRENLEDLELRTPRNESTFFFHVALIVGDQVFDFDYGIYPSAPSIKDFFSLQLQDNQNLFVKSIPASHYKRDYSPSVFAEKNFYYYLLPEYQAYEEVPLFDFLAGLDLHSEED